MWSVAFVYSLMLRLAVLKQHRDYFPHVAVQLVERLALAVRAGEAGHVADVQARVGTLLDDVCVDSHTRVLTRDDNTNRRPDSSHAAGACSTSLRLARAALVAQVGRRGGDCAFFFCR